MHVLGHPICLDCCEQHAAITQEGRTQFGTRPIDWIYVCGVCKSEFSYLYYSVGEELRLNPQLVGQEEVLIKIL